MEKEWKKELILFFQGMGMGINSFFKSRNEEWELIPFFKEEWEWDYNPKNQGMDPCLFKRGQQLKYSVGKKYLFTK